MQLTFDYVFRKYTDNHNSKWGGRCLVHLILIQSISLVISFVDKLLEKSEYRLFFLLDWRHKCGSSVFLFWVIVSLDTLYSSFEVGVFLTQLRDEIALVSVGPLLEPAVEDPQLAFEHAGPALRPDKKGRNNDEERKLTPGSLLTRDRVKTLNLNLNLNVPVDWSKGHVL